MIDDGERKIFLTDRWVPSLKDDFPVSYHNKNGKSRPRSINEELMKKYEWIAISRLPGFKGAWCSYCVLFGTNDKVGVGLGFFFSRFLF